MRSPGATGPAGTKPSETALPEGNRSKASTTMDQQNYEPARPASADPAVALAKMLGQLPKAPIEKPASTALKTSVEELAKELGLTLADQNGRTIRRIKRGKAYRFIRANGTQVRHAGTIRRLNRMA